MGTKTQKLSNVVDQIVEWQSVFTGDGSTGLTTVAGRGYFIDTTSGTVTVTLPASPKIGDIVQLKDYARTWNTNNVTIASTLFDGSTNANTFFTDGQTLTLVYMDGTKGWSLINEDTTTGLAALYVTATGGTITTSGDYKIHTFTGDGCFVVSCGGNPAGSGSVDYLVVAGGAGANGGPGNTAGGGGGGGFRYSASTFCTPGCAPGSPLANPTGLTVSATTYPITVGAGGSGNNNGGGANGNSSIFSTITSAGGGKPANSGGSGGGANGGSYSNPGAAGNTPPVSPPQGQPGGPQIAPGVGPDHSSGGGGGAAQAGQVGGNQFSGTGGNGAGLPNAFGTSGENSGSFYYFSGGGGGGGNTTVPVAAGPGGLGGGGDGSGGSGGSGSANTGGGAGAGGGPDVGQTGGSGGSGIVIIRYKYQ